MSYHEQCIKCKGDCCDGVGAGEMCRNCLKEEIELLKKSREIAILEGKIPRQIVETVAKSLGVKTGIWVGAIEEKISTLKEEIGELITERDNMCEGCVDDLKEEIKKLNEELRLICGVGDAHLSALHKAQEEVEMLKEVNKMVRKDWRDTHIMYLEGEQENEKLKETCNILSDDEQREALRKSLKDGKTYTSEEVRKRLGISEENAR